ncbi:leucine-rich repeat-containing protein 59 [Syngnathus acus]|uniref:leucine-rich repeat-containing protein 59 n=1 Tax=Syngnathus acus TaxID=161584 RepID=UPI001885CA08|nr:leucine-rich repeat-containing protein 59 [Syngnathus acus]XP_037133830.1 leucine-rich repeat-containing protein 59 [Syngnathus acus]
MSKSNKVFNLKDKLNDKEMDLSLCNLTEVPVKELALFTKATFLDLSCNNITSLPPEFCNLTHLVKLDLSKNQLTCLPDDIGNLTSLQHLDLYNNKLITLPVSFSQLRSLKWLDLKDNPLDAELAKVAGDCLDEKQCKQCATKVLKYMQVLQEEADLAREKRLLREKELERKREAKKREREAREKEARKREKAEEKEKRRKEYNAQVAAAAAVQEQQQQQKKKNEEKKSKKKNGHATAGKKTVAVSASKPCRSALVLLFELFLLLLLGMAILIATCRLTELRREDVCVALDAALDRGLTWAREQEIIVRRLLGNLSAAVKDFVESMQMSKS